MGTPYIRDHIARRGIFSAQLLTSLQDNGLYSQAVDGNNGAKLSRASFSWPPLCARGASRATAAAPITST